MKLIHAFSQLFVLIVIAGCSSKNSSKFIVPEKSVQKKEKFNVVKFDFNPKVDILFVVDNSTSMADEQEKIKNNINLFIDEFLKNEVIDYHIGVTTVYDSSSFGVGKKFPEAPPNGLLRKINSQAVVSAFPQANLREVFFANEQPYLSKNSITGDVAEEDKKNYMRTLLSDLIFVGTLPHKKGGPLNEEILSPILSSLGPMSENSNFYRSDAHLAIVLISDAEDELITLSPKDVADTLLNLKSHDEKLNLSVYGIISPTRDEDKGKLYASKVNGSYGCSKDYNLVGQPEKAKNPLRVEEFLEYTGAQVFSLCEESSFSRGLLQIGSDIKQKTLFSPIYLDGIPDMASLQEVKYGDKVIPRSKKNGWYYSVEDAALYFSNDIDIELNKGSEFALKYTPVNLLNSDTIETEIP